MASVPATTLEINLKRTTRVYRQNENLTGRLVITNKGDCKHDGIVLTVEGTVNIQPNPKSNTFLDSFYSSFYSAKPISLLNYSVDISKGGRLHSGRTDIPFELPLKGSGPGDILLETYHGVFITIQYLLKCDIKRSLLSKDLQESIEFYIEYEERPPNVQVPSQLDHKPQPMIFTLNPESLDAVDRSHPARREFTVDHCDARIRSIELQLVRVETCGNMSAPSKDFARDATEVQNIQIGEGDVERGIKIPIYMIFPRLFTCPTLKTENFRIEFEVNLVTIFDDNHLITENFPIRLIRSVNQSIGL